MLTGNATRGIDLGDRYAAMLTVVICAGVLGVAAWLTPSPEGLGTHTQMSAIPGMTDCPWLTAFDQPCATCGMTTAFAHAAAGEYFQSFLTQPFGAGLAVFSATVFWLALHTSITGSRALSLMTRQLGGKAPWILLGLFLAAWAYKVMMWSGN